MRAYRITTTVTAILVAAGIGCIPSREIRSTVSAGGRYTATISQERSFAGERHVYLNAARAGAPPVRKLLYTGDFLDDDFAVLYPKSSWESESVLRIGQADNVADDALRISNETPRRLAYLLIETYRDKIVLFDVEPQEVVRLRFDYIGQLSAEGEFLESRKRVADAVAFPGGSDAVDAAQFSIHVKEDAIAIDGPLHLQHVPCCAVDRPGFGRD